MDDQQLATAPTHVLLVDDEILVLATLSQALGDEGFDVTEATSGDEAMDLITAGAEVDILVSDIKMPGELDGLELSRLARAMRPDLKVILVSGHVRQVERDAAQAFFPKPFSIHALVQKVRELAPRPR